MTIDKQLYQDAVSFEPTWYEYYKQKAVFLLRWHGKRGELKSYLDTLASRPGAVDNAMVYFLTNEYASAYDQDAAAESVSSYQALKEGFLTLRRSYGVTDDEVNYFFSKARESSDQALMQELLPQVNRSLSGPLTKDKFERMAKAVEEMKALSK